MNTRERVSIGKIMRYAGLNMEIEREAMGRKQVIYAVRRKVYRKLAKLNNPHYKEISVAQVD